MIYNIFNNLPLPIYGNGKNSREWIHVKDHCEALFKIFKNGKIGEFYNIGSNQDLDNKSIVKYLLEISKKKIIVGKKVKIKYVKDRPGHDVRYALNSNKIKEKIRWKPKIKIKKGLENTFLWYLGNKKYFNTIKKKDILKRLGKK
jgi:dTDP-glucose 4,6-dehydratase